MNSTDKTLFWSEQSIELQKSEWVIYTFTSLESKKYQFSLKASSGAKPTKLIIEINDQKINYTVNNKNLSEAILGNFNLEKGKNKIKVLVKSNTINLDWIKIK